MKLKIGYFADGAWSHEAFQLLQKDEDITIDFICVRYDTQDKTLKGYAKKYNIDYLKDKNINSQEFIIKLKKYNSHLFVSMSFNQIFKTEIIHLPKYNTINCHAGKLPFYRGRNILNWVLINDEKEFGITVHYMDEGIDTGDIILQNTYPIHDNDNYKSLLNIAYKECASILYKAIVLFKDGMVKGQKQKEIHPLGFYCIQRGIGDEILNWKQTSREIFNFVRAICSPGPKARAYLNGIEMTINKVEEIDNAPTYRCIEGAILHKDSSGILVKTLDNFIKITEFEYEAKYKVGDRFEIR